VLKGPISVHREPDGLHLSTDSEGRYHINAAHLADDLRTSYEKHVKPLAAEGSTMQQRLNEMADDHIRAWRASTVWFSSRARDLGGKPTQRKAVSWGINVDASTPPPVSSPSENVPDSERR
jgi:hypothetical protein